MLGQFGGSELVGCAGSAKGCEHAVVAVVQSERFERAGVGLLEQRRQADDPPGDLLGGRVDIWAARGATVRR